MVLIKDSLTLDKSKSAVLLKVSLIKVLIDFKKLGIRVINSFTWAINSGTIKAAIKIMMKISF